MYYKQYLDFDINDTFNLKNILKKFAEQQNIGNNHLLVQFK
jgi:hypothetical protein